MLKPIQAAINIPVDPTNDIGITLLDHSISHLSPVDKRQLETNVKSDFQNRSLDEVANLFSPARLLNWVRGGLDPYVKLGRQDVSLLHIAALHGDPVLLKHLFRVDGIEEVFSNFNQSALHTAAQFNKFRAAFIIGAKYPDLVNHKDHDGNTALTQAISLGHDKASLGLVFAGANRAGLQVEGLPQNMVTLINEPYHTLLSKMLHNFDNQTVLGWLGDSDRFDAVVQNIDDVNIKLGIDGFSLLHLAVLGNNHRAIELLLQQPGIDLDIAHPNEKRTPLMLAVMGGDVRAVGLLLEANCNVNSKDYQGKTAYDIAQSKGLQPVMALLLEHGATPQLNTDAFENESVSTPKSTVAGVATGGIPMLTPVKRRSEVLAGMHNPSETIASSSDRKRPFSQLDATDEQAGPSAKR